MPLTQHREPALLGVLEEASGCPPTDDEQVSRAGYAGPAGDRNHARALSAAEDEPARLDATASEPHPRNVIDDRSLRAPRQEQGHAALP
jgi:hypothetical protein